MLQQLLTELEGRLLVGDFAKAVSLVKSFLKDSAPPASGLMNASAETRLRLCAAVAEVLAYLGENRGAQDWWQLRVAGALPDNSLPSPDFSARVRLQSVEHEYRQRRFAQAVEAAKEILLACDRRSDQWGRSEAAYYIARCSMRLHDDPRAVYCWCDMALEGFSSSTDHDLGERQWRMALVLLVSGFVGWQAGHDSALTKLLTARCLLSDTGDILAQAHAEHSLGCVYRSMQSAGGFRQAQEAFERAKTIYEGVGNRIHFARVLANIGRTHFDAGDWANAQLHLGHALDCAEQIEDEQARKRQTAEAHVYSSWLLTRGSPRDLSRAADHAEQALASARTLSKALTVEALLANGTCLLAARKPKEATRCFDEALSLATSLNIAKMIAHANLCLAELFSLSDRTDLGSALEHWRIAEQILLSVSSRYLRDKSSRVRDAIQDRSLVWMVTRDRLLDKEPEGNKFKNLRESLDGWIIDRLEEEQHLSLRDRARLMGVSAPGYLQKKKSRRARSAQPASS